MAVIERFSDGANIFEVRDEFNPRALVELREDLACVSQTEFARQAGINRATLASYETGRRVPSRNQAARIALALDVSLNDLYTHFVAEVTPGDQRRHSPGDTAQMTQPA